MTVVLSEIKRGTSKHVKRGTYDHAAIQYYASTHSYMSCAQVAEHFGCHRSTIYYVRSKYKRNSIRRTRRSKDIRAYVYGCLHASVKEAARHFNLTESGIRYHIR